jgi:hypothetical protein
MSIRGLFAPCDGVENPTPGQDSGRGDVKGLEKMRGAIQHLLPERKEVAQSVPDHHMVVSRGQIEREPWQGEASGLGTLSPGPPPLPPLKDSLVLLALPLLGGRAFAFS